MGRIICLMGKSSAGKDTIYKRLLEDETLGLRKLVPYTTRPIRAGEREGREYFYTDEAGFGRLKGQGKVVEDRAYHTCHGLWRYFTVDNGQIQADQDYLMIATLEAYGKLQEYFGAARLLPVLIELDDGIRLQRALNRERIQAEPKYEEMCRRFLADSEDFSQEKIERAGISRRFVNDELERCLDEIRGYIRAGISGKE
nr:guanylate kinase [uncultured Acetatifactor sp.]